MKTTPIVLPHRPRITAILLGPASAPRAEQRRLQTISLAALLLLGAHAIPARIDAAELLNDQFLDNLLTAGSTELTTTWYATNDNGGGLPWTIGTDNNAPLSGSVMRHTTGAAENTTMVGAIPVVTLAKAGDSISVTFNGRSTNGTASTGALIVGFGYDGGTPLAQNEMGTTAGFAKLDDIRLSTSLSNNTYFKNTTAHTVTITFTLASDGVSINRSATVDSVAVLADTIASPNTRKFNQLSIYWNVASPNVDNIHVTTNVLTGPLPVVQGVPQAMLTASGFTDPSGATKVAIPGKAGLACAGVDAERYVIPCPGDYTPVMTPFDQWASPTWTPLAVDASGAFTLGTTGANESYATNGGVGYASLYVYSPTSQNVWLETIQNGTQTLGWLRPNTAQRGDPLDFGVNTTPPGGVTSSPEGGKETSLSLAQGWNHVLLKYIMALSPNQPFQFAVRFSDGGGNPILGLKAQLSDPDMEPAHHAEINSLQPLVTVNGGANSNLPHPGDAFSITIDTATVAPRGGGSITPFQAKASTKVYDYSGTLLNTYEQLTQIPGSLTLTLNTSNNTTATPVCGYYTIHTTILDSGNLKRIAVLPLDGFSVIGGTASQAVLARKNAKKLAYSYYHMSGGGGGWNLPPDKIFPWMTRIGIYRIVGSDAGTFTQSIWTSMQAAGIIGTGDYWDPWHNMPAGTDNTTPGTKQYYAYNVKNYTKYFKGFNEVDIQDTTGTYGQPQRPTAANWVNQVQTEYTKAHNAIAGAFYIGGSFAQAPSPGWFQDCLALGLASYQDAWDCHTYPVMAPNIGSRNMASTVTAVETAYANRAAAGQTIPTRPFWIGECGAISARNVTGVLWQADTMAKMVANTMSIADWQVISFLAPSAYSAEGISNITVGHKPGEAALYTASALIDGLAYAPLTLSTAPAINTTATHSVTMRLTKIAAGIQITATMDGASLPSYVDTNPTTVSFDTLGIACNPTSGSAFRVDNLKVTTSSPATRLDEKFLDGTLTDGSNAGETDAQWYFYNSGNGGAAWGTTTDNTAPLSGTVMNNPTAAATNTSANAQFATASISAVGSYIEVSFNFRFSATPTSGTFAFALRNSNGTPFTTSLLNGGVSPAADDYGYGFAQTITSTSFGYTRIENGTSIGVGSGIQAAKFGTTRMLWVPSGGPFVYNLPIAGTEQAITEWKVVDVVGRAVSVTAQGSGAAAVVPVTLTDSPVYVLPASTYSTLTQ